MSGKPVIAEEVSSIILEEESCLAKVLESLQKQREHALRTFGDDVQRAKTLTSEIVAARRDVDKQLLASDEAVAHGLQKQRKKELESIDRLLKHPYFARLKLEEETDGKKRWSEFLLGHVGNIEARIVDWRNAPIAKLFYEYREGDYFCEDVQGREREGTVLVRNKLEMENGELTGLSCRFGDYVKHNGAWTARSRGGLRSVDGARAPGSLPDVLSLITPEQFQAITEEARSAVLIHGVAGSGKTTVALYRLAWLVHPNNSDLEPEQIAIIVRTPGLLTYIRQSLAFLNLPTPSTFLYKDWVSLMLKEAGADGAVPAEGESVRDPLVWRVLQSVGLLQVVEESGGATSFADSASSLDLVPTILQQHARIIEADDTGLVDRESLIEVRTRLEHFHSRNMYHPAELALVLRCLQLRKTPAKRRFRHFFVDEAQDFSAMELATVVSAAESPQQLTVVGDTAQATRQAGIFPGWDALRKRWQLGGNLASFVELPVSHRSTLAILRFAAHIRRISPPSSGVPGKRPLWFHCRSESSAVTELLAWLERVSAAFPGSTAVILCRSRSEAEYVGGLLRPTFGHAVEVANRGDIDFSAGVLVAAIDDVKGLEFRFVLLWNVSADKFPKGDEAQNRLYIGATRAQEVLCLITWGRWSPHLPSIESSLVRGINRTLEEDADEEDTEENLGDSDG